MLSLAAVWLTSADLDNPLSKESKYHPEAPRKNAEGIDGIWENSLA